MNLAGQLQKCNATGCTNDAVGLMPELCEVPFWRHPAELPANQEVFEIVATSHFCEEHRETAAATLIAVRRESEASRGAGSR